ncbi:hypothetical protein [Desulfosporosinus sp. SB140]|uniref:HNH endonuclease n=1 Tax=Desulfosporosinus paludis TaxID=3115649 RepID=UPI00388F716A
MGDNMTYVVKDEKGNFVSSKYLLIKKGKSVIATESRKYLTNGYYVPATLENAEKELAELNLLNEQYQLHKTFRIERINRREVLFQESKMNLPPHHLPQPNDAIIITPVLEIDEDIMSTEAEWMLNTEYEGAQKQLLVNKYERNPKIRKQAIKIHGTQCMACRFDFEKKYGVHGKMFIEVHHTVPLCEVKDEHSVNPKTDTVVLCANCHRMVHRDHKNPLTLEQLIIILEKARKSAEEGTSK